MLTKDTIILITGQLNSLFTERLIETYKNVHHKIISTWDNTKKELIDNLENNNFIVVLNNDEAIKNCMITHKHNSQIMCIKTGIEKAKELGYKNVLKLRTDIFSTDMERFVEINKNLYLDKIMTICGIETKMAGIYFLDIIIAGPVDKLLSMFVLKNPRDRTPFETYLLRNYTKKRKVSQEEMHTFFSFALSNCIENNIELTWYRDAKWKTPKRTIPDMKIIEEYCKEYCEQNIAFY
ncbi:MAG: hypothetical protein CMF80_08120 [Candidatus Marinimicrobia bacterium]|nr:hypothetical protein [Candidatus Neomarinimicrobiota bacterium]|tara:strand:- start:1220 stop:1930 length:711 start_codon:yes stop_codon:yes gene_type:complete